MASAEAYVQYIMEQLPENGVSCRKMMGEYVLYYRGKVCGGIYDNRFLIKPTKSAQSMLPDALWECPYEGAKPMLLVDRVDDRQFLAELLQVMYLELPDKKKTLK